MSKNILVILNPAANGERAKNTSALISRLLPEATIRFTHTPGEARLLAATASQDGFATIVACGGDGTMNEVVNGMVGQRLTLGVIPVGTANVFATDLGIPHRVEDSVEVIRRGKTRVIDLARANEHWFIQLAGVGLDAQIVKETSWESKKMLGPLSYLLTLVHSMNRPSPRIRVEEEKLGTLEGAFVLVGNGRYYGGPFTLFPNGELGDGFLDVCVFQKQGFLDLLRYMEGITSGRHTGFNDVHYFQTKKIKVNADEPLPIEVDGEVIGSIPVEFTCHPQALSVLAP